MRGGRARALMLVLAMTTGGCTVARMRGFDTLAAGSQFQPLSLTGLPWGDSGHFRLGAATGQVAWHTGSDAVGWGPDGIGAPADQVRVGEVARFGVYAFDLDGGDLPGHLEARCRYGRTEARNRILLFDIATIGRPLRLQCRYRLDGRDAGMLQLAALPPGTATGTAEPRRGMIRFDGRDMMLQSDHDVEGARGRTRDPMGYRLTDAQGRTVAVVETNGLGSRRLLLSRDPAERPAAIAAAISLALFRDPGDTD